MVENIKNQVTNWHRFSSGVSVGAGIYALETYFYDKEFSIRNMILSGVSLGLKCMINCTMGYLMGVNGMYSEYPKFSFRHPIKSVSNIIKYKNIEIVDKFIARTPLTYVYNLVIDPFFEFAKE